jgi:tRNA uridine 5-carboxymethylaminomethyl modification enzyme
MKIETFDVIVIGAGHAGCEASLACARMGFKTLVLTINLDKVALMPCNPAIGGVGKTQLVLELDAMGGQMGKTANITAIQVRMLNRSKGPAVRALRAQIDKKDYEAAMKSILENTANLTLRQGTVNSILVDKGTVQGVTIESGITFYSKSVIVATGTFLRGRIILGSSEYHAGRMGEYPSMNLTESITKAGLIMDRFQTATPPRVDKRTIDFSKMTIQPGEDIPASFSFWDDEKIFPNIPSYLTYTNEKTHDLIRNNISLSPIKSGMVTTHGPRHCPSIDRKVINYENKNRHPVFVEPEGSYSNELYLQGLTTSMPAFFQQLIVNTVAGLENARIMRPGYAVEYDYLLPNQLKHSLECKSVVNLFFAGQVNGTSGYEEAAAQGFIAGVNVSLKLSGKEPLILKRNNSYIGVLIDDLINKELSEPYRMYTSRSEYRLSLRPENADTRLSSFGYSAGLLKEEQYSKVVEKNLNIKKLLSDLSKKVISVDNEVNNYLIKLGSSPVVNSITIYKLLQRPEIKFSAFVKSFPDIFGSSISDSKVLEQVETYIKYKGYIDREYIGIKKLDTVENIAININLDYSKINGLTLEAREKLSKIKPETLGQASRIAGISPADISILMVVIKQG